MHVLAAIPTQRDTGKNGSTVLFKEDLAITTNSVKHGFEIAVRKGNKIIGTYGQK